MAAVTRALLVLGLLLLAGCAAPQQSSPPAPTGASPSPGLETPSATPTAASTTPAPQEGSIEGSEVPGAARFARDLTTLAASPNHRYQKEAPVLSAEGNLIAFSQPPQAGAQPMDHVYVVRPDAGWVGEIDSYATACACTSMIDVSADGRLVAISDTMQLRVAPTSGGGGKTILSLASGDLNDLRLSGDGSSVFVRIGRDTSRNDVTPAKPMERGIWMVPTAGGDPVQVVSPATLAAAEGVDQAPFFQGDGEGLDVSKDGSRVVFEAPDRPQSGGAGQGLFGATVGEPGVHDYLGRVDFVYHVAISGDGSTVAYHVASFSSGQHEVDVVPWDGTQGKTLAESAHPLPLTGSELMPTGDRLSLSADGRLALLGSSGMLYRTDTGAGSEVGAAFASSRMKAPLFSGGLDHGTMDETGTRFEFLSMDDKGVDQVAFLSLPGPSQAGASQAPPISEAPSVTGVRFHDSGSLRVSVRSSTPVVDVEAFAYVNGTPGASRAATSLDTSATGARVGTLDYSGPDPTTDPPDVGIEVEAVASSGMRYATATEFVGTG